MPNGIEEGENLYQRTKAELNEMIKATPVTEQPWIVQILTNAFAIFGVVFRQIWDRLDDIFTVRISRSKEAAKSYNDRIAEPLLRAIMDSFKNAGLIDNRTYDTVLKLKPDIPVVDLIYNVFVGSSFLKNYLQTASQGMSGNLIQQLNKDYRPNLPDANAIVQAAFIAPEKTGEIREILKRFGLKDSDIDLLFIARYQLYDIQMVQTLYLRKIIDKEKAYERLREMGFTDTRIEEMMATWEIIPGPQDLLMMVAKEAFEPDEIARYGLSEEFPEAQSEWLTKQGLSRFWQEKYWQAHWDYPSYQQVLNLLYRGIITEEDVNQFYRVIEIPTYWREKLTKANYLTYTRVDTRRMHQMGVLSDEELVEAYKSQGYDQEKAEKMAEFTKRYNNQSSKAVTQSQITKAYGNDMISRDDAMALLMQLKYGQEQADFILMNIDFDKAIDLQNLYVNAIKAKHTDNLLTDNEARTQLNQLNLPGARIDALMTSWIAIRDTKAKLPSKTDLDKFFKAGTIKEDDYKNEMYKLGYNFNYTQWYLSVLKKPA
jgi:hypothetical protein